MLRERTTGTLERMMRHAHRQAGPPGRLRARLRRGGPGADRRGRGPPRARPPSAWRPSRPAVLAHRPPRARQRPARDGPRAVRQRLRQQAGLPGRPVHAGGGAAAAAALRLFVARDRDGRLAGGDLGNVLPLTYAYDALDRATRPERALGARFRGRCRGVVVLTLGALAAGAATMRRRSGWSPLRIDSDAGPEPAGAPSGGQQHRAPLADADAHVGAAPGRSGPADRARSPRRPPRRRRRRGGRRGRRCR